MSKSSSKPKRSSLGSYRSRPRKMHTAGDLTVDSGYEAKVLKDLQERGVPFSYNPDSLEIKLPLRGGNCTKCGASGKDLYKSGVFTVDVRYDGEETRYIELKGRLTSFERTRLKSLFLAWGQKFKLFILFQKGSNKLNKGSKTTYEEWARGVGFVTATGDKIPEAWVS